MKPLVDRVIVEQSVFGPDDCDDMRHIKKVSDIEMHCIESLGHGKFALRDYNNEFSILSVNEHGEYLNSHGDIDIGDINVDTWQEDQLDRMMEYVSDIPDIKDMIYMLWLETLQWTYWSISEKKDGIVIYYDIFLLPDVHEVIKIKLTI